MIDWQPDDYRGDPYRRMTNQSGHLWLGFSLSWLLTILWPPLAGIVPLGYIFWEARQYFVQGGYLADGMWDIIFALSAAGIGAALAPLAPWYIQLAVPFLSVLLVAHGYEIWNRIADND